MSLAKKLEEMKSIERKNKTEKDDLKAKIDIHKGENDLLKRKLENETQLMIDHQNALKDIEKQKRTEIQMLKVCSLNVHKQGSAGIDICLLTSAFDPE